MKFNWFFLVNPPPTLTWFHNGKKIKSTNKTKTFYENITSIKNRLAKSSITINQLSRFDLNSVVQCQASITMPPLNINAFVYPVTSSIIIDINCKLTFIIFNDNSVK